MGVRVCVSTVGDVHQGMEQKMRGKRRLNYTVVVPVFFSINALQNQKNLPTEFCKNNLHKMPRIKNLWFKVLKPTMRPRRNTNN